MQIQAGGGGGAGRVPLKGETEVREGGRRERRRRKKFAAYVFQAVTHLPSLSPSSIFQDEQLQDARRQVQEHFARLPARYALNVEAPEVVIDMGLMAQARADKERVTVDVQPSDWDNPEEARSSITISCTDRPNLLDAITRIISALSSTIVDADCMTSRYAFSPSLSSFPFPLAPCVPPSCFPHLASFYISLCILSPIRLPSLFPFQQRRAHSRSVRGRPQGSRRSRGRNERTTTRSQRPPQGTPSFPPSLPPPLKYQPL